MMPIKFSLKGEKAELLRITQVGKLPDNFASCSSAPFPTGARSLKVSEVKDSICARNERQDSLVGS
jgi:hypothetical protein